MNLYIQEMWNSGHGIDFTRLYALGGSKDRYLIWYAETRISYKKIHHFLISLKWQIFCMTSGAYPPICIHATF